MGLRRQRWLALVCATLILVTSIPNAAAAITHAEYIPAETGRIENPQLPQGVTGTPTVAQGKTLLTLTEGAQWEKSLDAALDGGVFVNARVKAPEGQNIVKGQHVIFGGLTKDSAFPAPDETSLTNAFNDLQMLQTFEGTTLDFSVCIAEIQEVSDKTMIVPLANTGQCHFIQWLDESGNIVSCEKYMFVVDPSALGGATEVVIPSPPVARLTPNSAGLKGMAYEYESGKGILTYTGTDRGLLTEGLEEGDDLNVETKIAPPDGAIYGSVDGARRDDGPVTLYTACTRNGGAFPTAPQLYSYKIVWYDGGGEPVSQEYLWITFVNATGDVWTQGRWDAIEENRIEVNESFAGSNVNIYTDDGSIDVRFESGVLPKVGQLKFPYFTLQPPAAAVKYKAALQSGPKYATDTRPGIETDLKDMTPETIPLGGVPFSPGLMQQTNIADSSLTLWYSKNLSSSYADTIVIDWYNEAGTTIVKSEYVMCTVGKFALIIEEPAVGNLPEDPVQNPTIISENNWVLRTEYVPQSGDDAVFYELSLKDEDGGVLSSIEDGAPVVLPFPEGMDYFDALGCKFVIRHYNIDLKSYEEIEAEVKECGLVFTAKGFSPYMLLWESDESAGPIVTFDAGGGAFYDGNPTMKKRANKGGKVEIPDSIYQWGHAFQGWYTDEALTVEWDFDTAVTVDITLYAKWEEVDATSLEIIEPITAKVSYTEGDQLDLTGLDLNVVFDPIYDPVGWTIGLPDDIITTYPANGTNLTTADKSVTITYKGASVVLPITVNAKSEPGDTYAPPITPSPTTVTDQGTTKTGASVSGAINPGAVLTVGALTLPAKGKNAAADAIRAEMGRPDALILLAKDIKLSTSFTGRLTITLPVNAKYNGQTAAILHDNNGTLERYTAVVTNGQVVFEVTSLSPFVVLLYTKAIKVPNTGAPAGAFPFVLLALSGAAGIAAAYRKRARVGRK